MQAWRQLKATPHCFSDLFPGCALGFASTCELQPEAARGQLASWTLTLKYLECKKKKKDQEASDAQRHTNVLQISTSLKVKPAQLLYMILATDLPVRTNQ